MLLKISHEIRKRVLRHETVDYILRVILTWIRIQFFFFFGYLYTWNSVTVVTLYTVFRKNTHLHFQL